MALRSIRVSFPMRAPGIAVTILLLLFLVAIEVSATNLVVTKTADTGDGICDADCSLREAVFAAAIGDVIHFGPLFQTPQTITLLAGEIVINKSLTITGPGPSFLSISGNDADRIFKITNAPAVAISGVCLRNGRAGTAVKFDGGAIVVSGSGLTLSDMSLKDNVARF